MDTTAVLGGLLIIAIMGWITQAGYSSYWRDRCRDLEATAKRPRTPRCDPPPQPAPIFDVDGDPTMRITRVTVPAAPAVDVGAWPQPRSFIPAQLMSPCPNF